MIGLGKQKKGLYIWQKSVDTSPVIALPIPCAYFNKVLYILSSIKQSNNSFHVWHCRLGHPSPSRMPFLSNVNPTISTSDNKDFVFTICPMANQKRLHFSSNNHLSCSPFDLIHVIFGTLTILLLLRGIDIFYPSS